MGKIKDIIARVDDGKFNEYSDQQKLRWLSLLDGQIAAEVYLMAPQEVAQYAYLYPDGLEMSPLVDFPNDDIYDFWLTAQIDFHNGEYEKYQNTMEMFNSVYGRFVNWFLTYKAPEKFLGEKGKEIGGGPFYYITAYGLAVKQGFKGTLEQWLESLIGPTPEIQIGNVTTVPYGKPAEVSLRGSALNPIFDFAIPRGLSDLDTNFGEDNNTGLLGYYYSAVDFENKTVTLSTEQGKAVVPEEIDWAVGDVVSIVNGGKYEQCAAIVGINGHVLTLDNIPFDKLDPTIKDFDDRSIYVSAKPEAGVVDLGKGAIAMGVHNKSLNRGAVALGEDNEVTAQYGTAIGRLNKVHGYAGFVNGRENVVHPGAKYGRASGLKNEVWGEESIAEGHECKAYAKGAKATGYKTVANGEFSETAGHQSETIAEAKYAYAGGHESRAEAAFSHVTGLRNISRVQGQLVGGRYNEPKNNEVFTIGCGTSKDNRQNALSVRMDGTTDAYGHKIVNVAPGVAATDAVNKEQLDTKAPAGYGYGGYVSEHIHASSVDEFEKLIETFIQGISNDTPYQIRATIDNYMPASLCTVIKGNANHAVVTGVPFTTAVSKWRKVKTGGTWLPIELEHDTEVKVLWENSSIGTFAAQTITLNTDSSYDCYIVDFVYSTQYYYSHSVFSDFYNPYYGATNSVIYAAGMLGGHDVDYATRNFKLDMGKSVSFNDALPDNHFCIPVRVVGIRW